MTLEELNTFKDNQKKSWGLFAPLEIVTTLTASSLVNFSRIKSGDKVLDVGCGTGVIAITAARLGAKVSALDLSPPLVERARENISIAEVEVNLTEGDVETLPYEDNSFDAVLSQFGHMFAPRPKIAMQEMLRVLKPGGIIAFSTWPPHLYVGQLFSLVARYAPPPPFVSPSVLWGDPHFVVEQLGNVVENLMFQDDIMRFPALSLGHYLRSIETTLGPVIKMMQENQSDPTQLDRFRNELKTLASSYYKDNFIHQYYLMSRALKKKN